MQQDRFALAWQIMVWTALPCVPRFVSRMRLVCRSFEDLLRRQLFDLVVRRVQHRHRETRISALSALTRMAPSWHADPEPTLIRAAHEDSDGQVRHWAHFCLREGARATLLTFGMIDMQPAPRNIVGPAPRPSRTLNPRGHDRARLTAVAVAQVAAAVRR